MISSTFFLDRLGNDYLGSTKIIQTTFFSTDIEILEGQSQLFAGVSYFCDKIDLILESDVRCEEGTVVFICGCERSDIFPLPDGCTGIMLSCTSVKALNLIARHARFENTYLEELNSLIASGANAHQFIKAVADKCSGDAVLLDDRNHIIFTTDLHVDGLLQNSLSKTGQLPDEMTKDLLLNPHRYRENIGATRVENYETAVLSTRAVSPSGLSATLLLEIPARSQIDVFTLMHHAHDILKNWMLSGGFANAARINTSFQALWDRIRSDDVLNEAEMVNALENLPHPIKNKICVAAMCFETYDNIPYNYILARLRNINRDINVAIENRDIILILPPQTAMPGVRSRDLEENSDLKDLLNDFNAYIMYGNHTGRPRHIKDVFFLTKKTLVIAKKISSEKDRRIFFYEDFASYAAIDIAAQNYLKEDYKQDAYMLVHPAVLDLTVRDREKNDDLANVLFYYLIDERNLKKTADDLHMHRNTVMNKLKKIESLTHLDFDDFRLRQRIIFSSQFMRYYEKVLNMPLPKKSGSN